MELGKVCTKCGIEKEAISENFSHEKHGKFGVKSVCKDCINKQLREKREAGIYPYICTHCGKDYLAKEKCYNKFCSRKCFFEHIKSSEGVICECCGGLFIKEKRRKTNVCTLCNQDNIQKQKIKKEIKQLAKNLSKEINKINKYHQKIISARDKIKERNKECLTCGGVFIGISILSLYCSPKCRRRAVNRKKEMCKGKRGELILSNGNVDKDISLERLIHRDNNICYLCGDKCHTSDYTVTDEGYHISGNSYPSIDHVIAIANGGTHTWENVKLAHRYCNSVKSDNSYIEQISNNNLHISVD